MPASNARVPVNEKLGYGMGSFGLEFVSSTISIFILYFLTDVAMIGAAAAGLILMATHLCSAIADPVMGYISDHTKARRPFLLFGGIALPIFFYFLWQVPDLSAEAKFWYYFLLMLGVWMSFTITSVPFNAILPNITTDSQERASLAGYSRFFVLVALIVIGGATKPLSLAFGPESIGFSRLGLIYGILIAGFLILCFLLIKERVHTENTTRYKIKEIAGLIRKNEPFLILMTVLGCVFIVFTTTGMMVNYFFKYNIDFEAFIPIALTCLFLVGAIAIPLWIWLSSKVGKRSVFTICLLGYGLSLVALFFVHSNSLPILLTIFIISGIHFSGVSLSCLSLLPDTVEYTEWKHGVRTEGAQYGIFGMSMKLSGAIAALFAGLMLDLCGYVANVPQTESSLLGIRLLMTLVPAAFCFIGAGILQLYPINEAMHKMMCKEIEDGKRCINPT